MEMCYIYTAEYYLVVKKNEIMKFAGKWIMLETVILSEAIQTYDYRMLSLIGWL